MKSDIEPVLQIVGTAVAIVFILGLVFSLIERTAWDIGYMQGLCPVIEECFE